jgi:hypothetical protein
MNRYGVMATHKPTGRTVFVPVYRSVFQGKRVAVSLLRSLVAYGDGAGSGEVRRYDFKPPLGLPDHIRCKASGRWFTGDEADAAINRGELDGLILARRKAMR